MSLAREINANYKLNLIQISIKNNIIQAQLTEKLGLTNSVISAYETGLRMPSYDVLILIAKVFKITTDYLLGLEIKNEIDFSGFKEAVITALLNLIKAMKQE